MPRTALLIRCDTDDADRIRSEARMQGTTISSYVLQSLTKEIEGEERQRRSGSGVPTTLRTTEERVPERSRSRTAILVRCEDVDAERIRLGAKRRALAINTFIIQSLKRTWQAT